MSAKRIDSRPAGRGSSAPGRRGLPEPVEPIFDRITALKELCRRIRDRRETGEDPEAHPVALTELDERAVELAFGDLLRLRRLERERDAAQRRQAQIQIAAQRGARPVAAALAGLPPRRRGAPVKVPPFQLVWDYVQLTTGQGRVLLSDATAAAAGDNSAVFTMEGCPLRPRHALEILANHHGLESDSSCRRTLVGHRAKITQALDQKRRWQGRDPEAEPGLFQMLVAGLASVPHGRDE